jgi:UDP-N-acetylmuramoylalanine--D-glutamate ligase
MKKTDWKGKSVLILGAGRQGLALAQYLAARGAQVTLNDSHTQDQMTEEMTSLQNYPIQWVLGGHPLEILDYKDLICLSGGIPLTLPIVEEAVRRGLPISNDSQLFLEGITAQTIGITGSAGKTTTTTLVGRMATQAYKEKAWIGGNIGNPLILHTDEISSDDLVILELSSFQLEQMTCSPSVAAILNITPNHLDRHGTIEAYTTAKRHILDYQEKEDIAILNREDPGSWNLRRNVKGKLISFGLQQPPVNNWRGTFVQENKIFYHSEAGILPVLSTQEILLRGKHNILNVLAAVAIGYAASLPIESIQAGIRGFGGVAHRLEFVRQWKGAAWYNDSIATAPERTIAAIQAFEEPLVLLLGGRDKKLPWEALVEKIHQRVDHVIVFGEAAELIMQAIGSLTMGERPYSVDQCSTLEQAVAVAADRIEEGDIVLLSPGGTSYDAYKDFAERGEWYRKWVKDL